MSLFLPLVCVLVSMAVAWWFLHRGDEADAPEVVEAPPAKKKKKLTKVDITAKSAAGNAAPQKKATTGKAAPIHHALLVNTLRGHSDTITDISYSWCGRFVASVSADKTVRIWTNLRKGETPTYARLNMKIDHGTACAFSDDNKFLAVATSGVVKRVVLYTVAVKDGKVNVMEVHSFPTKHKHDVTSLLFGAKSKLLITMCRGQATEVHVWKTKGELIKDLNTKQMENNMAALSHDGSLLCVATRMSDAKIYGIAQDQMGVVVGIETVMALKGHKKSISSVCFAECDEFDGVKGVASACVDGTWRYHALASRDRLTEPKLVSFQPSEFESISHLAVEPVEHGVVALAHASSMQFSKRTGELVTTIPEAHKGDVNGMEWSKKGCMLATHGDDKSIRLWSSPK